MIIRTIIFICCLALLTLLLPGCAGGPDSTTGASSHKKSAYQAPVKLTSPLPPSNNAGRRFVA